MGFLIATLIITILYITFIISFTELTTSIPNAGGPFAYAYKAFGATGGLVAGYATLIEFVFAPPAIAFALGSYVHFLHSSIPVMYTAVGCYIVFNPGTIPPLNGVDKCIMDKHAIVQMITAGKTCRAGSSDCVTP